MSISYLGKVRLVSFLFMPLLVGMMFAGCPPCPPTPPSPTIETHTEKVYFIGDVAGVLAEEMPQVFVNLVSYDGVSADAPIFIAAEAVETLSEVEQQGLRNTFNSYYPIVVVNGSPTIINALLRRLDLDPNCSLPAGEDHAELFAVDREEEGYIFTWFTYPPEQGASPSNDANPTPLPPYTDNPSDQLHRVAIFHAWLDEDGCRATQEVKAYEAAGSEALTDEIKGDGADLIELALKYVTSMNISPWNNHYQLSYFIASCHSFKSPVDGNNDCDWFYVRQVGALDASGEYKGIRSLGDRDICEYYVDNYRMNNWMDPSITPVSDVILIDFDPQTLNGTTQITSGVDWNLGGSVGFQGQEPTGSVSGGVAFHYSTQFNISDCAVTCSCADADNNAKWRYNFAKCGPVSNFSTFAYSALSEPPLLSRSTFKPTNQWIWKFAPTVRDNNPSFLSQLDVDLVTSAGGQPYGFWISGPPMHTTITDVWAKVLPVPLPYPPVLVVPHNLDFGQAGSYQAIDIGVARPWTASSNQDWCQVEPLSGAGVDTHIRITVDPNTTGANRTATITFVTTDGHGRDIMNVGQNRY